MEKAWNGVPFRPISQFYQKQWLERTYKIPVVIADDCPNRRGLKGMKPCVFCDEWGSAANAESFTMGLKDQIEKYHQDFSEKYKSKKFLIYFQAYTNTFLKVQTLREHLQTAVDFPFVQGVVIGTRPDCISKSVLDLWNEFQEKTFVGVELGVQSFFDHHLNFMQRGHSAQDSILAIHKIAANSKVDLGIHLIFGNPGETEQEIIETAKICNDLPISNVKLHNLHVLKNTPLAEAFKNGQFFPIEFAEYCERVGLFLDHLSPNLFVHRLAAYSSRWDELIAPRWTANKMRTHQGIIDYLRAQGIYQGRRYQTRSENDLLAQNELKIQASAR